jgi:regulatory protein
VKAKLALLRLLSKRELSSSQALKKLLDREFPGEEAQAAVVECQEAGYIDDGRYAERRVRYLLRRRKSNSYIRQKLVQEGIAPELIEAALPSSDEQEEALAHLLRTRYADKPREKTIQALQRQGFPLYLILSSPEIANPM